MPCPENPILSIAPFLRQIKHFAGEPETTWCFLVNSALRSPQPFILLFAETHTFVKNGGVVAFWLHAHVFPIYRDVVVDLTSRFVLCNAIPRKSNLTSQLIVTQLVNLSIRTKLKLTSERVLLCNDAVYNQIFFHRTYF